MNASQCRAARHLLGWSSKELARASGLSLEDIRRFEDLGAALQPTMPQLHQAFEAAGVEFGHQAYAGFGVRLKRGSREGLPGERAPRASQGGAALQN